MWKPRNLLNPEAHCRNCRPLSVPFLFWKLWKSWGRNYTCPETDTRKGHMGLPDATKYCIAISINICWGLKWWWWQFLMTFFYDDFDVNFWWLVTCDIWDTDYNTGNWEPGFITIFVTWQLIVTLDSIRNSCDVCNTLSRHIHCIIQVKMIKSYI